MKRILGASVDDHIETTSLTAGVDGGRGMAIDDMGRIVVGGIAGADMGVVRYLADGTLDAAFDGPSGTGNGKFAIDVSGTDTGEDMKIDTQGRIVISGNTNGATDFAVIRLNEADGTLDSTFGTGGKVIVSFTGGATTEKDKALMVQTDGRIVVAGQSGSNFAVARLSGGGTRYYAMQDANWNVTGVADGAGNVVERYQYDPYGKVTVLNANFSTDADNMQDVNEPFLFQGLKYDANSGNYNARNRDLRSTLGSWIQADPSGYPDGANRYQQGNSNTLSSVDPLGLWGWIVGGLGANPSHEGITLAGAKDAGFTEGNSLVDGVIWTDAPQGINALRRYGGSQTFGKNFQDAWDTDANLRTKWNNNIKAYMKDAGVLETYESQAGDNVHWHAMVNNGNITCAQQVARMVDWILSQYQKARAAKDAQAAAVELGKGLHTIQDSYSMAHTVRTVRQVNGKSLYMEIEQFQDYATQDHDKHEKADDASRAENADAASMATTQTSQFLQLYMRNATVGEVKKWLTVGDFAPFNLGKECKCGGTDPKFKK